MSDLNLVKERKGKLKIKFKKKKFELLAWDRSEWNIGMYERVEA